MEGIPTRLRGINFRSRLEAKWACVFDELGWSWSYEPFDLPGWVPDFLIRCGGKRDLLIDIKPIARFDVEPTEIMDKIDTAVGSDPYWVAILGVEPVGEYEKVIGWLRNCESWDTAKFCTSFNDYEGKHEILDSIGLCQEHLSYHDVIRGDHSKGSTTLCHDRQIERIFRDALNAVQWNRREPRHIADVLGGIRL